MRGYSLVKSHTIYNFFAIISVLFSSLKSFILTLTFLMVAKGLLQLQASLPHTTYIVQIGGKLLFFPVAKNSGLHPAWTKLAHVSTSEPATKVDKSCMCRLEHRADTEWDLMEMLCGVESVLQVLACYAVWRDAVHAEEAARVPAVATLTQTFCTLL